MKRIFLVLMMLTGVFGAYAAESRMVPDSLVRRKVVVRRDTVSLNDTIVRCRTVERIDTLFSVETTLEDDSVVIVSEDGLRLKNQNGGYLWIPDSLRKSVESVLEGKIPVAEGREERYATFRGDTVPMILRSKNFGRYDRGLFNHLFIPKGIWQFGATASYGEFSTEDLEILDLISDIDFSGHIFSIRPYMQYFIANNMSVGMRLSYTSGKANIGSFNVDIDDDMNFNLHDIMYKSESYSASLLFNQYFGMSPRGRFGIFNEVELAFASGNSDFIRPYDGVPKHTHSTSMGVGLNFSPGLSVFIMDPVSFNISFGVFGFSLKSEKQKVDDVDMGRRLTSGANFRFNIFNINFGIAINL